MMPIANLVRGAAFALAAAAPNAALAQDIMLRIEATDHSAPSISEVVVTKLSDATSPNLFRMIQQQTERMLAAAGIDATPSDIAATARDAAATVDQWHKDFIVQGNCHKSPSMRGTGVSGRFVYRLDCRNCRPRNC